MPVEENVNSDTYMKYNTLGYTPKCRIYDSLQQLLSPSSVDDLAPPPHAAALKETPISLSLPDFSIAVFRNAENLPAEWDSLLPKGQLVLSRAYLNVFAQNPPEGMGFAYLLFYKGQYPVGLASCQLMEFRALRQIQSLRQPVNGKASERVLHWLKRSIARRINTRIIICGAAQFSGEYAFLFDDRRVPPAEQAGLLEQALGELARQLEADGWKPNGIVVKDFYSETRPHLKPLSDKGYTACAFQPNMVLTLRPEWQSFEDYLNAMSSKYRVRARRAIKKRKQARLEELDMDGVRRYSKQLHELYIGVAAQADFNLLQLPAEYFLSLKEAFPQKFRVLAYFQQDQLIGFCTTLRNGQELEAHFIGFRQEENREFQLYLNMLYDMVRLAIEEEKVEQLIFSRTAMEIKSSVGAEPRDMYCYLRYLNGPVNRLAPAIVRQLEPQTEWRQRHPFSQQED